MSATILAQNGTTADIFVRIAWGADLTADPDTWVWTDVTADVRVDGGDHITWTVGRQDEASQQQPGSCTVRLDNRTGAYSLGPKSLNWPYVKRNTPLQILVTYSAVTRVMFVGFVDSWVPSWSPDGRDAVVTVTTSGILRRLAQGKGTVVSPLRRALTTKTGVIAYWPMEDGKNSIEAAPAVAGTKPLICTIGAPKFADETPFDCSAAIVDLDFSNLGAELPKYAASGAWQARVLMSFPENGMNDGVPLLTVYATDQVGPWSWEISYGVGGTLRLTADSAEGGSYADSGYVAFNVDGQAVRLSLSVWQNGADIAWAMSTLPPTVGASPAYQPGSVASQILSPATEVKLGRRGLSNPVVGHLVVENQADDTFSELSQLQAYFGEGALTRFLRLCSENNIPAEASFPGGEPMGIQPRAGLLELLRECETAEQGLLLDSVSETWQLFLVARSQRFRTTADLTLSAADGDLLDFTPVDDDQALRNRVSASRPDGATVTIEDTDGPLGTATVGVYEDSLTVNCLGDVQVGSYAGWQVHQGTVPGYRYPSLQVDLAACPESSIAGWLGMAPSFRIDVTDYATVRPQHPDGTVASILYGYTATVDKFSYQIEANLGPAATWLAAVLDDTDETLGFRAGPPASAIAEYVPDGTTALQVYTAPIPHAYDTFDRTTSNGWGVAPRGGSYAMASTSNGAAASAWSTGSFVASWSMAAVGRRHLSFLPALDRADLDITGDFSLSISDVTGAPIYFGLMARGSHPTLAATMTTPAVMPLYFYPAWFTPGSDLPRALDVCEQSGQKNVIIANVSSGPGGAYNSDFAQMIEQAHDRGQLVVGYVDTNYAYTAANIPVGWPVPVKSLATIKAEIDDWYTWYTASPASVFDTGVAGADSRIDGIFLDQVWNFPDDPSPESGMTITEFYRDIYEYIKAKASTTNPGTLVVGNPGVTALTDWQINQATRMCDRLVAFEGPLVAPVGSEFGLDFYTPPAWFSDYDPINLVSMVYDVPSADFATTYATMTGYGFGSVFITDQPLIPFGATPYNAFPAAGYYPCTFDTPAASGASSYLLAEVGVETNESITLRLWTADGSGTLTPLSDAVTVPGMTHNPIATIRVRLQVDGRRVRAKVWHAGATEPVWQIEVTASAAWNISGWAGAQARLEATNSNTLPVALKFDTVTINSMVPADEGVRWTTDAADFPMKITVGEAEGVVTAISGSTSPQTFILDSPLPGSAAAGSTVTLDSPPLDL